MQADEPLIANPSNKAVGGLMLLNVIPAAPGKYQLLNCWAMQ